MKETTKSSDGSRSKAGSWAAGRGDEAIWAQTIIGMETHGQTRGDLVRTYTLEGAAVQLGRET